MKMNKWITPLYMCSLIFPMSSSSWLNIWIGLEINLMMFMLILNKKKSMMMSESMMKYFLIQATGSLMFLTSLSMNMIYYNEWPMIKVMIPPIALMLKMGLAPIHMWMPEVVKNFNMNSLLLFLTVQKINPLLILYSSWYNIIFLSAIMNIMIGSLGGINEPLLNKMLVYSSITNSGWMITSLMISNFMFIFMFTIYTLILFNLILIFKKLKIKWILQLKSNNFFKKLSVYTMFMSMGGLPPLLGFIPKWMIIKNMINYLPMYSLVFIMFSCLNLFFYLKFSLNTMMPLQTTKKWMYFKNFKYNAITITTLNFMGIFMFNIMF
uniref:NADH-ubiquinone oxidoreductase chain 2 n=1 Tax=Paracarsidara gigantea TaxID=2218136 RepID=A0A344A2K8_9HEMI|nr:NADH dehydrogenase subunit 2 [Paracarsidara gigantea]AWU48999.1 NADH dehydrogenase subunit 2 [Paracarsidara gigantea]